MIHPVGHFLIVLALTGDGIHQHGTLNIRTAEESDGLDHSGADPIGGALLVDLKDGIGEHHGGIMETQMAFQFPPEVLRRSILHSLVQTDHFRLLRHHVDDKIGRQTVRTVGEPLHQVAVGQGGHPDRAALVVDLGIRGQDLKLGDHVAELAQLPAAQPLGGVRVQHGDLVVTDLLHLCGEVTGIQGQQLTVAACPDHYPGGSRAHSDGGDQRQQHQKRHRALLFHKLRISLDAVPLKAGGEHRAHAVYGAEQKRKDINSSAWRLMAGSSA